MLKTPPRRPGHRRVVKEDHRGIGEAQRGPHLVLLARDAAGWRSLCRMVSRANLDGTGSFTDYLFVAGQFEGYANTVEAGAGRMYFANALAGKVVVADDPC